MKLDFILRLLGMYSWVVVVLAVLALLLLGIGLLGVLKRKKQGRTVLAALAAPLIMIVPGVVFAVLAVLVLWANPHIFPQLLGQDYVDRDKLAQLQQQTLGAQDQPAAGAWPQWRGPNRDGISGETGIRANWTEKPPTVVWKKPLGKGYSSVSVAGGRAYVQDRQGDNERVVCLAALTGESIWEHVYGVSYTGFISHATGPRASPTIHDGRVYTVGARGNFLCLEAVPEKGPPRVLWQHDLLQEFDARMPDWGVACSPLIEGDLVIVQPGGSKGSVAAFHRVNGNQVWSALSDVSGYSSPVAATLGGIRQIVCLTGEGAAGLNAADGKELWYYRWPTPHRGNIATPIVVNDYVFLSSGYNTGCVLLKVSGDYGLVKAEPVYIKRNKLMRNHHSSCVLHDGHLYGFDVGAGLLKCIDLARADEKWSSRGVGQGCALYADGHLIVLSQDGNLALVEATPEEFRLKGQMNRVLQGSEAWALPSLADGRLYLRDHEQIVCLDLRK